MYNVTLKNLRNNLFTNIEGIMPELPKMEIETIHLSIRGESHILDCPGNPRNNTELTVKDNESIRQIKNWGTHFEEDCFNYTQRNIDAKLKVINTNIEYDLYNCRILSYDIEPNIESDDHLTCTVTFSYDHFKINNNSIVNLPIDKLYQAILINI